jgi:cytochrome c-type biogenesis protein CcmH/NrfG
MLPSTRLQSIALLLALLTLMPLAACQKHVPPPSQPQPTPAQRLETARQAVVAGNCAQTLTTLDELVGQLPQSAEAFLLLGLCAAKQNVPERAETALSKAASLEPDNPRPLEALGILRYTQARFPAAKDALTQAANRNSANPQTYYYLGNLAMQTGNCPDALANYRKAMAKDPAFSDAFKEYRAAATACAKAN